MQEYAGRLKVVKINCTDSNKSMMERFKVYGLPCLLVFNGGAEVEGSHREGAISRKDLVKYIEKHVGLAPTTPLA
jgi:thioredoxin-like negative regulator of GroEL